ncbi:MAG: hypothetical protein KF760_29925 [Candidatus Eremiobacteraeota bacterium]|nr:hypothetical protein [Candidatus Eremiobacteraeota bacterium]MCW5866898.1 hypothetical protein [Candidatus Eremiobacteraeota bacterium]
MSGNVEDEARARLDVAQLYEDMGQMPKAIRYYLEAAQIYREGGVPARHRELCNKILRLDPGNAQAQEELNSARAASGLDGPPAPSGESPPPPAAGVAAAAPASPRPPAAGGLPPLQMPQPQPGKVLIPTPWLFRDPRYVQSAKKQLTSPLQRSQLPFDPLPKVDPQMVMIKQEQRKKQEEEAARKASPIRESAFAKREGSVFTSNKPSAPPAAAASAPAAAPAPQPPTPGGGRAGNLDLAEAIRRRMQEKGK